MSRLAKPQAAQIRRLGADIGTSDRLDQALATWLGQQGA